MVSAKLKVTKVIKNAEGAQGNGVSMFGGIEQLLNGELSRQPSCPVWINSDAATQIWSVTECPIWARCVRVRIELLNLIIV